MRYLGHISLIVVVSLVVWMVVAPTGGRSPFPDLSIVEWIISTLIVLGALLGIVALAGIFSWLDERFGEPTPVVTGVEWADFNEKLATWNENQLLALHGHLTRNDPRRYHLEMVLGIGDPF